MKTFTKIYDYLSKLSSISGTNAKIDFIKMNNDCSLLDVYKWLYDSSRISGIAEKKWDKVECGIFDSVNNNLSCIGDCFAYLDTHNTGRDEDVRWLKSACNELCSTDEEKEMFKKIICKNLPLGVDVKTINKCYENLIPTFDVMLANAMLKMEQKQIDKITNDGSREFAITEKCDGFRCVAIKKNGVVKLVSRQGKLYEGCVDIQNALLSLEGDFVLDSEIIVSNRSTIPSKEQYKATSNIVTKKDCEKHGVTLNVFDYISIEEWESKGKIKAEPWYKRNEKLMKLLADYSDDDSKPLYRLPLLYVGNDLEVAYNLLAKAREENKEGVMLRFTDSAYEFKRSNELLKLKAMEEIDAYIVGYECGTNKNSDKLGAFHCEIEHPKFGKLKFKVGSGYSDNERISYWENRDNLVGRVMEVQYFEVTQNSTTKEYSVRFPVHKCIKDEGTIPNN